MEGIGWGLVHALRTPVSLIHDGWSGGSAFWTRYLSAGKAVGISRLASVYGKHGGVVVVVGQHPV